MLVLLLTKCCRNINTFSIYVTVEKMYWDCDIHQCFALQASVINNNKFSLLPSRSALCSTGALDILLLIRQEIKLRGQWLESDPSFTGQCLEQFLQLPRSYFWFASPFPRSISVPTSTARGDILSLDVLRKRGHARNAVLLRKDNSKKITAGKCSINPVALRWHINLCSTSCHCVETGTGAIAYPSRFDLFCEQWKLSQHLGPCSLLRASCIIISMTREIYFKLKVGWVKAGSSINNRIRFPLILKNDWVVGKDNFNDINELLGNKTWIFSSLWSGIKYLIFCQICSAGNEIVEVWLWSVFTPVQLWSVLLSR